MTPISQACQSAFCICLGLDHNFPLRILVTISGSGEGTVEIGATTSSAEDTGGQSDFTIGNPASGATVPRINLGGHTAAVPYIYHADVISEPA